MASVTTSIQVIDKVYVRVKASNKFEAIIRSASPVVDACYFQDVDANPQLSIYCITQDGALYTVGEDQLCKFNTSSVAEPANQEIFSDLLTADEDIALEASTEPVYLLESKDRIYLSNNRPLALCVFESFVAIASEFQGSNCVQLFSRDKLSLPESSPLPESFLTLSWKCEDIRKEEYQRDSCSSIVRPFIKVVAVKRSDKRIPCSNSVLFVDREMFKQLFGQDCALLDMPVIITTSVDGDVYFAPVNSFRQAQKQSQCINKIDPSLPTHRWTLLCHLTTAVVDILTASFSPEQNISGSRQRNESNDSYNNTDCLLICSKGGVITVLHRTDNSQQLGPHISMVTVSYPLICCAAFCGRFYHSTGTEVYESSFMKTDTDVKIVATTSYRLQNIVQIQLICPQDIGTVTDSSCSLQCSTTDGDTKVISVSTESSSANIVTGEVIQNLLTSLEELDTKHLELQEQTCLQDFWLKQVHLLAYLQMCSSKTLDSEEIELLEDSGMEKSFRCVCMCSPKPGSRSFTLSLTLTNQMPVALSHDWSIMVKVFPGSKINTNPLVSKAQRLSEDLGPSKSMPVLVDVDAGLALIGAQVDVFAVLNMPDPTETSCVVALPVRVCQVSVDVLYFLRQQTDNILSEGIENMTAVVQHSVMDIAQAKPAARLLDLSTIWQQGELTKPMKTSVVNNVYLDSKSAHYLRKLHGSMSLPGGLLKYLIKDAGSDIIIICPTDDICSCKCTVLNQSVVLTVTMESGEDTLCVSTQTRETTYRLIVTSQSTVSTSASLHKSIAGRLKSLKSHALPCKVHVKEAKKLLQTLQELTDVFVQQKGRSSTRSKALALLKSIYEQLRSGKHYT